jgi:hypothetical protein
MYRKFNDLFSGPSNIAGPGICQPLSSFPRRVNLPEASGTDCGLDGRVHPKSPGSSCAGCTTALGDREQEVVELNSKVPVREERNKNKKVQERPTKIIEK